MNAFSFDGFPGVSATKVGDQFEIRLSLGPVMTSPLMVPFGIGKSFAKAFREKKQIEREWFEKVQDLLIDIERQYKR